jgi:peroxiredoxin (alkyl hydroperoxide reductase subunit C)
MSLIARQAPDFTAKAVMADGTINESFNLKSYLNGSLGVLFFYPLDFTFVCPSEIIAFDKRVPAFDEIGAKVVGVSVDSQFSHYAWRNTPVNQGGIGPVQFPLVADLTKSIARSYDVLLESAGVAFRGTFVIDKAFNVRHATINDLPLGRNVEETIRMADSILFHEKHGEVCPAGWQAGKPGMKPTKEGVAEYLSKNADAL